MYTFVIVEYDIHQFIIHINISKLSENPEHYSDIKNLLPEIRKRICTKEHLRVRMAFVHSNSFFNTQKAKVFMPNGFNYGVTDGNLVRFRCIMPMPHTIQTDKYPPRFIGGFFVDNLLEIIFLIHTSALDNGMNAGNFNLTIFISPVSIFFENLRWRFSIILILGFLLR